jgi:hypothetical protein
MRFAARARALRGKTHSSHGGRKAYLNFELKDAHRSRLLSRSAFRMSKLDRSNFDWRAASGHHRSLTSKFRYAEVCRAMNGKVWPERPSHNAH